MEEMPSHITFPTLKKSCCLCSALCLLFIIINSFPSVTASGSDLSALLHFKSQLEDDPSGSGILNSWNLSLPHCQWPGITCSRRHRDRVTALDLPSQKLGGTLSPYVGNLTFLRNINLSENNFHGQIPQEIGRLFRLQHLDLSYNSFEGEIPSNLTRCTELRVINLFDNELSGKISAELSSLSKLLWLVLFANNFTGSIPPSLGNLSSLTKLLLSTNDLEGSIPDDLCRIRNLGFFQLSRNKLTGKVPSCLFIHSSIYFFAVEDNQLEGTLPPTLGITLPNIQDIYLGQNKFTGPIPVSLSNCIKLQGLSLEKNNFIGYIPSSLGNLSSLTELELSTNHLEGSIPDDLCRIRNLGLFDVSVNKLTGKVPSCLFNHSSIFVFSVSYNQLEGTLPPTVGITLPNIQKIFTGLNKFIGPIPVSISNWTRLELLEFSDNYFSGSVPSDLGRLQGIRILSFSGNQLGTKTGDDLKFITSLTNCTNLEELGFDINFLKGPFPNSISNLTTKVKSIWAGYNQINGHIPLGIQHLVNIERFHLHNNHLTGNIPAVIGKLNKLQSLYLGGNMLSGRIPTSLGNLTQLLDLDLGDNNLSGSIPHALGKCQKLMYLNLARNNLIGTVPEQVISLSSLTNELNLSRNFLTGPLPSQVGNLTNLMRLSISENNFSGHIPESLGKCLTLVNLEMNDNFFEGTIPKSLSTLRGLQYFDLSRNNLSGEIPEYLEQLPLLQLNLSSNQLEGQVPNKGVFGNVSAVSVVGNTNLCGGISELQLPPCIKKTKKTSFSIKMIIPVIVGSLCFLLLLYFLLICYRRIFFKRKTSSTTLSNQSIKRVSYSELLKATNGFSAENLIGVGSYGSVFKGILQEINQTVAVKVLNLQRQGSSKSFHTECKALKNMRHRNLLKIITSCSSVDFQGNDFKALIFEFMPKGSLEEWLHPRANESGILTFIQRLNIAIDVASALEYLHHHCQPAIVHCDVKPNNVLLDDDMTTRVADFGIAKIFSATSYDSGQSLASSVAIKGSVGYVAPEYGMGSEVSTQGDAYSYEILLLEMFTRKKPTDDMFLDGLNLHNYSKRALPNQVLEIVDPMLLLEENVEVPSTIGKLHECLVSAIRLGVECSIESPLGRMTMGEVVSKLHHIRDYYEGVRRVAVNLDQA